MKRKYALIGLIASITILSSLALVKAVPTFCLLKHVGGPIWRVTGNNLDEVTDVDVLTVSYGSIENEDRSELIVRWWKVHDAIYVRLDIQLWYEFVDDLTEIEYNSLTVIIGGTSDGGPWETLPVAPARSRRTG